MREVFTVKGKNKRKERERESQQTSNNSDIERINMTVEKRKVVEIEMGDEIEMGEKNQ